MTMVCIPSLSHQMARHLPLANLMGLLIYTVLLIREQWLDTLQGFFIQLLTAWPSHQMVQFCLWCP